jgi:hypothetical protein
MAEVGQVNIVHDKDACNLRRVFDPSIDRETMTPIEVVMSHPIRVSKGTSELK